MADTVVQPNNKLTQPNGSGGKLNAAKRKRIPSSKFGLPGERKYPIENAGHARDALARASEMRNRGVISDAQYAEIARKAHRLLGR